MNCISPNRFIACLVFLALLVTASLGFCQEHSAKHEHHGGNSSYKPEPPKVFLDKSPRVVGYQLKRLDNQRLLMVERQTSDKKFIPVYEAILTRSGMTSQYQQEAVAALCQLQDLDPSSVLLKAIDGLDTNKNDERKTAEQLIEMVINQSPTTLKMLTNQFQELTESPKEYTRITAFAAMLAAGQGNQCFKLATESSDKVISLLKSFQFPIDASLKDSMLEQITSTLEDSESTEIRQAAIQAISNIQIQPALRSNLLFKELENPDYRDFAVRALLSIPTANRSANLHAGLADILVRYAEATPAEERTTNEFTDAMQLADQSLSALDADLARTYRTRLDAITVRMIRIRTVEEEMRYDVPYFVVQAGKPIQVILENHDLMPHNLVISKPGTLKEVAQAGLNAGPTGGSGGLAYVPDSDDVLFATDLVPSDTQTRLTFNAPATPGEYPYVCTFPQHWYRMYGVMVVVEDLDQWLTNPIEPANPIGNNRSFVQSWKVEDLDGELLTGVQGRSKEIGQRLFNEASCRGCHQIEGEGGKVGPDLSQVVAKWKGDQQEILREILEPSHRVDEAYQMQKVLTVDGQTLTGIRVGEDDEKVLLITNPESSEPTVILQEDIEIIAPSATSMMPKALLDQYTKDEIFEILAYIQSNQKP